MVNFAESMIQKLRCMGIHKTKENVIICVHTTSIHICVHCNCFCIQIQWNDGSEGALSPSSKTPHAHYHRRFSAQFSNNQSGYSTLVLCYNRKLKILQVLYTHTIVVSLLLEYSTYFMRHNWLAGHFKV